MRKNEAKRLRDIADFLDEYFLEVYFKNHKHGFVLHYAAEEIRKIIVNGEQKAFNKKEN